MTVMILTMYHLPFFQVLPQVRPGSESAALVTLLSVMLRMSFPSLCAFRGMGLRSGTETDSSAAGRKSRILDLVESVKRILDL